MEVQGVITKITEIQTGVSKVGKEWKKQTFVIDTGAEYNPDVALQVFGEKKIEMLSKFKEGDEVEVGFNLSSREYNGNYFHNVDAWRMKAITEQTEAGTDEGAEEGDLPF